ncbi:hypothetical protein B0H15DRAFT_821015 [Mycena belliarum]|uniref:Endoplasmic reticulum junction formation protein lunapark n=1 Tax=Mycena belliarum TaxID=1033014 RepID=A0AAD6UIU6_9AGAR|nr:hypothetical protein B0H15DRAFT_821015 [Mycena belliae]
MSFIWRLFRAEKPADDYETVLSALATTIQKRQTLLSEIRARERKATMLVTLYTLAAWLAYVAVWYFGFVSAGATARMRSAERAVRALPVFVGPIFILFIRRIVQVWYNRKGNAEEKTLQVLLKEQRTKVEEIKKKTNFYSTRELLARYDADVPGSPQGVAQTPQRRGGAPNQGARPSPLAATPEQQRNQNPLQKSQNQRNGQPQQQQQQQRPAGPPKHTWFDALADLLVGAEEPSQNEKYALICAQCFAHNGLVREEAWADAQYTCPKCGHFNPAPRSRGPGVSPTSPAFVPPTPPAAARPAVDGMLPGARQFAGRESVGGNAGSSARQSMGGQGDVRRRGGRVGEEQEMMEVDS